MTRHGLLRVVAAAVALGATLGAQNVVAVDVHVLAFVNEPGALIPTPQIAVSRRLARDPALGEMRVTTRFRDQRIVFEVTAPEDGDDGLLLSRNFGTGARLESVKTRIFDVIQPWRFSRRPRRGAHVRFALLCDAVGDPKAPFRAMDVRAFFRRTVDILFEPEPLSARIDIGRQIAVAPQPRQFAFGSARWKASLVLGAVPIEDYLDTAQVDRILDAGTKVARHVDDDDWTLLRPLVALCDEATLRALAARTSGPEPRTGRVTLTPDVPRSIHDSIVVAYASATEPKTRGLAGWVAAGTRGPDVVAALVEDFETGRAILPGTPEEQKAFREHLATLKAWQSVTAPAGALLASAFVIGIVLWLMKRVGRGWS